MKLVQNSFINYQDSSAQTFIVSKKICLHQVESIKPVRSPVIKKNINNK